MALPEKKTAPLPSRDDILAFIAREREAGGPRKIGVREIARAFGLKNADRAALKRMLRELADAGLIERRRKILGARLKTKLVLAFVAFSLNRAKFTPLPS